MEMGPDSPSNIDAPTIQAFDFSFERRAQPQLCSGPAQGLLERVSAGDELRGKAERTIRSVGSKDCALS